MGRSALIGTIATLGVVALAALFTSFSLLFTSPDLVYAQTPNNAPAFSAETATRSIDENTDAYTNIGSPVAATDLDSDDRLVYSIQNAHTSPFTIVRSTGQLQVGQPLDYETKSSYTVTVQVTDSEDADGNFENPAAIDDTITVTITVNNVDEAGKVSLTWTRPQENAAVESTLSDPDGDTSGTTWKWERSSGKSRTGWSTISGATSASYTPVSNDVDNYLRVTASYTDEESSGKTAQTTTARWVKADLATDNDPNTDNQAPAFADVTAQTGYHCAGDPTPTDQVCRHIPRNTTPGDDVYYPVKATDPDNDQLRYSLGGTDAGLFTIEQFRGTLYTKTAHAFNGKTSYSIIITATDPSGDSDNITVTLSPSGGGANPVVEGPDYITYPENGTWPLAAYSATIKGHIDAGTTYSYIGWIISVEPGGGDGDFFDIDGDGNLIFTQPPDYENPADEDGDNQYNFSLTAYDTNPRGGRSGSTFFYVTVVVTDETAEPLEIDGPSAVRYAENGTGPVANYSLEPAGTTVDNWVLSGADGNEFNINATGELTFKRSPDFETPTDTDEENDYLVTITAYTSTNSKTEFVRVQVTDVNEPPEFDEGTTATRDVAADAEVDDLVGEVIEATDPDDGDLLSYSLPDDATLPFSISEYTGQLAVDDTIDGTRTSYTVAVIVTDNDPDDSEDDRIIVTVNVTSGASINSAPTFPAAPVMFSFDENPTAIVTVGTVVAATDDDSDDLSYTLGGTDAASFDFNATTRQIKTKSTVTYDYEAKSSYSVTVTADDDNGGTDTKAVTINLNNLEETGTVTLSTNQPTARSQVTATLIDPDGGVTGTTWQWSKSDTQSGNYTNISSATSENYTPSDGDVGKFLKATASYDDDEGTGRSAEATTTGAVQSGTNRPPTFDDGLTATREVAENTAAGGNVGAVVAATDDDNDSLTYSLTSTDEGSFTVDNTGQIKVKSGTTLDYESAKNTYTVVVQVTDSKTAAGVTETNPTIDDSITVTINVTDVDEDGTVTLSMTHPSARTPITATLTDLDSGVTGETWQWAKSTDGSTNWTDVGTDSSSYTPPDEDVGAYLRAIVSYEDTHGQNQTAEAVSANAVQAGANRAPTFPPGSVTRAIDENSGADVNVGSPVTATDLDTSNTLTYTLEGTDKDSFKIVSGGQIKTKSGVSYDFETKRSYSVMVKANDGNTGTATKAVTITLNNLDEAGTVRLSPTQPVARSAVTAILTDPDIVSGTPTWQWAESTTQNGEYTNITDATTNSYTPTDDDLNKFLKATASYTDGHGPTKSAHAVSSNAVQSGTNRSPTFDEGLTTIREVAENTGANGDVGAVVDATDDDSDSLTYSLTGQDDGLFIIGPGDGQIKVKTGTVLDYEGTRNSYTVIVQVHDGKDPSGNANTAIDDVIVVTINVTDVDEDGTVSLSMTHPAARTPVTATLTDPDSGVTGESWQWAKSSSAQGLYTDITTATSATYTPSAGDVGSYLRATVSYEDKYSQNQTAQAVSANAVQAGANRAPTFASGALTFTFDENPTAVVTVGTVVAATDDDNDDLTYTLGGADMASFDFDATTRQIKTKSGVTYDYEAKSSYSVTVKADDGNGGNATNDVTINLNNLDEAGAVRLSTNQPSARVEMTATVTDPDQGVTNVTWQWAKSSNGNDPWTDVGTNSSSYTPADGDLGSYLRATASYTDDQASDKTAQAQTSQTVQTGSNRPADFSAVSTTRDVAENTAVGQPVGAAVTATDADDDDLTYSLSGGDASLFDFDTGTGQIKVKTGTTLDYEGTRKSYTVAVEVNDGKNADGTTNTAMDDSIIVTINVTDVEEAGTVTLSMSQPKARAQLTATLTDPDGGVTGTTWVWARSEDPDDLTNHPWETITNATSANYTPTDGDEGKFLKATASYTDRRGAGKTAEAVSANAVGTGTNRAPDFGATTATREFPENTPGGQDIGNVVKATDADNDVLHYTLEGTDAASFQIVGTSGQIQTGTGVTYNHEAKDSYSVTVKADDNNGGTDTIDVTITVNDVNEKPAFTATPPVAFSIAENTSANTNIGAAVGATDPDDGDTLFYSLDEDSTDIFAIDSSNGQLKTKAALDKETTDTYTVTVSVRDSRDANGDADTANDASINVTINVTDVNEPPEFPSTETGIRNVTEGTAANQAIGNPVAAEDPDVGATLTYTLGGTDLTSFDFDTTTGQLKTKAALDKETKATYTVTVSVTDGKADDGTTNNAVDDTITVIINVTDSNEPPTLSGSSAVNYAENGTGPVSTYTATDPEGATIDWSLTGTDASAFTIDGGVLKFKESPDYEDSSNTDHEYSVTVVATDGHNPVEKAVTVTITDANDPPYFNTLIVSRTVNENTQPGSAVGLPVSAEDEDNSAWERLTYSLGGEDSAAFGIDRNTGLIKVGTGTTLDFETRTSYLVVVTVTDVAYTSDTIVVKIKVSNVDEPGEVTLSQAQAQVDTPLVAGVSDPDGITLSTLTWAWEISADGSTGWGAIAGATSASYTPVSADVGKFLRVTASYTDGHGTNKTATATLADAVRAVPATNAAPDFPSTETGARSVAENTAAGENVGDAVVADDDDTGDTLTYTLGGVDSQYFSIVRDSGQIQTRAPLDHEAKSSYTVTVTATDPSRETATITVTITVTDVNEPPLAPGIPAMVRSSQTSVTMVWTAPNSTGRPAVTDYDYRYKKNTETNWTEVTNTAITGTNVEITGLEATTYYDVQVRAISDEGTGDWSATGIAVTRTLPNAEPDFQTQTTTRQVAENTESTRTLATLYTPRTGTTTTSPTHWKGSTPTPSRSTQIPAS